MARTNKLGMVKHGARLLLGTFMLFAGIAHLTFARRAFRAQVPDWLPMDKDRVVVLSGVVEIGLGLLIIFAGHRSRSIPWLLAIFFVLVFPGNIAQYLNHRDAFGLDSDTARLARLFFQPVLIYWALWSMGAIPSNTRKNRARLGSR